MSVDIDLYITNERGREEIVYDKNITYNLSTMAKEAGLYEAVFDPEDNMYSTASDIIEIVRLGVSDLINRPEHFKTFNPENGWGSYDGFLGAMKELLEVCEEYPEAKIDVCR